VTWGRPRRAAVTPRNTRDIAAPKARLGGRCCRPATLSRSCTPAHIIIERGTKIPREHIIIIIITITIIVIIFTFVVQYRQTQS